MNLREIVEALEPITSAECSVHDREYTSILLTPEEYSEACAAISSIKLADMLEQQRAIKILPKLIAACEAALTTPLPVSIRRQLEKAIVMAKE